MHLTFRKKISFFEIFVNRLKSNYTIIISILFDHKYTRIEQLQECLAAKIIVNK